MILTIENKCNVSDKVGEQFVISCGKRVITTVNSFHSNTLQLFIVTTSPSGDKKFTMTRIPDNVYGVASVGRDTGCPRCKGVVNGIVTAIQT